MTGGINMDLAVLKQMYQYSPFGFAYQRVIFDKDETPEDYIFLYVNPAFEELTGLSSKKIINQRISKVLPRIRSETFDWIRFYGEMVLQNKQEVFEQFSEPLNRWYKVHAYPTDSESFCTLFMDVTEEKDLNNDLGRLIHVGQRYMTEATSNPQFQESVDEIREISQAKYAVLNLYNEEGTRYHTVAISGGNKIFNKVSKILGFSIRGKEWDHDPARQKKIPEEVNVFPNLRALTGHSLSSAVLTPIEKLGGIGQVVVVKIMRGERMIGDFTLFMSAGKSFNKSKITQSFAHFFGLILLRKDAEKERRKLAHDYEMVFQSTQAALFLVRVEETGQFRYLRNNKTHQKATGIRLEDLQGKSPQELLGIEFGNKIAENYRQCLDSEQPFTYEETLALPGGVRTWLTTLTPVWENNSPSYIVGSSMDITEQKRTKEDLKRNKDQYQSLVNNIPGITYRCKIDANWTMLFLSSNVDTVSGYSAREILNNNEISYGQLIYKEDREKVRKAVLNGVENKMPWELEYRIRHKDGTLRWAYEKGRCVYDNQNNPLYLDGFILDISPRKKMEKELKESELRFSVAIDGTQAGVWDWNTINNEVIYSTQWKRMLGYEDDEVEDKFEGWKRLWHPEDAQTIQKAITDHMEGKTKKYEIIHRCRHKDGSWRWIMTRGKILKDKNGKPYRWVGTNIDITKQKEIEYALKQTMQKAEAASKAKSEFLANMSHEIRTPLNSVIGFTDLLMKTQLTDIQKLYCENANGSGKALLGIINDILDFSKIEAGKLELEYTETDVVDLIQQTADIIKYHAEEKGLEVLMNIEPGLPRVARLDPVRLKQILTNLLSNAVKFTETGEVEIKLTFSPLEDNRGVFHFSIRDTGIGIKMEQKEKLFKAFSQADSTTTRKFGGTGLGLIISNSLVEKMGDSIHLDSIWGKGSTFSFSVETEYYPMEIYPEKNDNAISQVKRVLVLDDNASNRAILSKYFAFWGITVKGEDNPLATLKNLEKNSYDLLILDYHMPYINGLETLKMIREKLAISKNQLPAIILRNSSDEFYLKDDYNKLGMKGCLVKPVNPEELYRLITATENNNAGEEEKITDEKPVIKERLTDPGDQPVILIVEDVASNMLLIKSMITYLVPRAKLLEAENGQKSLEILKFQQVDLVLMDVQMPVMDGIQATKQIREWESENKNGIHLPIIALTAGALKEEQRKALDAGMDEFLTKPIEQDKLQACFNKYLNTNKSLEHIDYPQLLKMVGGDKNILEALIQTTIEDMPERIEGLTQAIEEKDIKTTTMIAHAIKGLAANLHFDQMAIIAKDIETKSQNSQFDKIARLLSELKAEWETVLKNL